MLASQSQQLHHAYSPGEIEALAALRGLQFATESGFENVVLEGDSQVLMFALQQEKAILTSDGLLIEDVCLCSRFFNQLRIYITLVSREKVIRLFMVLHVMHYTFQTLLRGHHLFFLYFRVI